MSDEINVDQLLSDIEAPAGERPMAGDAAPAPAAAPAPDWRSSFDWKFKSDGAEVEPDSADKAKTWLSLGHRYSQRVQGLNQREAEYNKLAEKYKGFDRYAEIDSYAKENPQWWQHIEQTWAERAAQQPPSAADPALAPILERLQQTEGVLQEWQQQRALEQQQQQDQALDTEISEIRKSHPNIDLNAVDPETGRTLEWKVLNHANENGIQSFKAAFRDLFHDKLVEEAKAQGRVAIAKEKEAAAKKGLLGTTSTPTKGQLKAPTRGVSWNSPEMDAGAILQELGFN